MKTFTAKSTITFCALLLAGGQAFSSSHSDAPLIKQDPQANLTDVYAFLGSANGSTVLNVIVNCRPFSEPGDGSISVA